MTNPVIEAMARAMKEASNKSKWHGIYNAMALAAIQALKDNVSIEMRDIGQDVLEDDYKEGFSTDIFQAMIDTAMKTKDTDQ